MSSDRATQKKAASREELVAPTGTDDGARARSERKIKLAASRARIAAAGAATTTAAIAGSSGGASSGGGGGEKDILYQMRRLRNREAAAVSRKRQSGRMGELELRVKELEKENRELRWRLSTELGQRESVGSGTAVASVAAAVAVDPDCDGDNDDDKKEYDNNDDDDGGHDDGNNDGDDDDDDGGDDDKLWSEEPGHSRLGTIPAAATTACFATASDTPIAAAVAAAAAAAAPWTGVYGHAMPASGTANVVFGAACGAARGAPASFNMISRPAVFA